MRGDLGQFTFPPKSTHYEWMSQFRPVFYIRQRDYSKTINKAPFVVNYSGCLFREYPGPWQVMLRKGDGEYACVAEDSTRRVPTAHCVPVGQATARKQCSTAHSSRSGVLGFAYQCDSSVPAVSLA